MSTPEERVAEAVGRAIDGQILALLDERATLSRAVERIAEIDAELALLQPQKQEQDAKRPRRSGPGGLPTPRGVVEPPVEEPVRGG